MLFQWNPQLYLKVFCTWYPRVYSVVYSPKLSVLWKYFPLLVFIFILTGMHFTIGMQLQFVLVIGCYRFISVSIRRVTVFYFESLSPSSTISPLSISDSVSDFLVKFWMLFSFSFRIYLKIPFHWIDPPSTSRKQCLFFGVLFSEICGARSFFFSFWITFGPEICFRWINFLSSVVTV